MPDDALTRERVRAMIESKLGGAMNPSCRCDDCVILSELYAALDDPARWCGVVGVVKGETRKAGLATYRFTDEQGVRHFDYDDVHTGRLIVTPDDYVVRLP